MHAIHAMHAKQGKVKHQKSKSVKISQSNRAKVKKESQAMKYVAILTQRLAKAKSKAKHCALNVSLVRFKPLRDIKSL